tara:strand:+ start:296 stop:526 length:231 start_codon:yes stop_codon:yes gene_type:complete
MQKIGLFFTGLFLFCSAQISTFANAVTLTNDPAAVNTALTGLADNAITLFDKVVPVILAVVGLSILIAFVKKVRKS